MYQTGIIVLIASVVLSLCLVLLLHAVFTSRLKKRNQTELEAYKQSLQTETAATLDTCKEELNKRFEDELSAYKAALKKENKGDLDAFKQELKATAGFEVTLIKTKIKNSQPSYPKRLEAQQKLAVLSDTINNLFVISDPLVSPPVQSFKTTGELIGDYLVEYAGVIDSQTEDMLRLCVSISNDGKNVLKENGLSDGQSHELVVSIIEQLGNAKRMLKSSTVQTRSI